jgi:hypothetical protein
MDLSITVDLFFFVDDDLCTTYSTCTTSSNQTDLKVGKKKLFKIEISIIKNIFYFSIFVPNSEREISEKIEFSFKAQNLAS